MSAICVRKQGKGRSSKRKGNRRCPFLFAPAAGRGTFPPSADGESPAEVQRKTSRPLGANPPAAVRVPRSAGAGKGAAPSERTCLRQFVCPGQPVQKKVPPVRTEPACGSSCAPVRRCRKVPGSTCDKNFQENMRYPLAKYAKIGYYIQALFCMNSRMMLNDVKKYYYLEA